MASAGRYPTTTNPYGSQPFTIAQPPSIYSEILGTAPGTAGLTTGATGVIGSELAGTLSPGTLNLLQDKAADYGVSAGMPGLTPGSLALDNLMNNIGLTSEGLSQAGVSGYGNFLGSLGATQSNPNLTADVSEWNSLAASAPNPTAVAGLQQQQFQQYLDMMMNPAGGTGNFGGGDNTPNPWALLGPGTTQTGPGTYHTPNFYPAV